MIASVASPTNPSTARATTDEAARQRLDDAAAKAKAAAAPTTEQEPAAVVTLSPQGAEHAASTPSLEQKTAADASAAADKPVDNRADSSAPKSNKPDLAYEAADTDKDSKVSTFEKQSYHFRHPEINAYKVVAQDSGSGASNSSSSIA
ncbi:hypothetical protein BH11PSE10_BH11PSE10_00570 [soil metagenome]